MRPENYIDSGFQVLEHKRKKKKNEYLHVSDDLYPKLKHFLKKTHNIEILELENDANKKYFRESAENNTAGFFPANISSIIRISSDILASNRLFDVVRWILNKFPNSIMRIETQGDQFITRICGIEITLDPQPVLQLIKSIGILTFKNTLDARASDFRAIWNEVQKRPIGLKTVSNFYVILTGKNFLKVWEEKKSIAPNPEPTSIEIVEENKK